MSKNKRFATLQLNTVTVYDFLNSALEITPYLDHLVAQQNAIAVWVGNHNLYGINKFLQGCKTRQLQPFIGLMLTVEIHQTRWKISAFAPTTSSYQALLALTAACSQTAVLPWGEYAALLAQLKIVFILNNTSQQMYRTCTALVKSAVWDPNHHFFGCETAVSSHWAPLEQYLLPFAPVRYLTKADLMKYQALQAIKHQIRLATVSHLSIPAHWKSAAELATMFSRPCYGVNLARFASRFRFNLAQLKAPRMKKFASTTPKARALLRKHCQTQLAKEFNNAPAYQARFEYEFKVIVAQNWVDYLLIVADYIAFARQAQILVGPGRGSACGSLICYLLKITTIDPIKHQLIFERFLNPNLKQTPDVDTDFEDLRREEVVQYLFQKYGSAHCAQIATFQTIGTRMAIRDIGRILGIDLSVIDAIAKNFDDSRKAQFQTICAKSLFLQQQQAKHPQLFQLAEAIIDLPRQVGTHAAGIVFLEEPITTVLPCTITRQQTTITQFDMYDLHDWNVIKMDLLGLKNLTVLHNIVKAIKHQTGQKLDLFRLQLDDRQTFADLQAGKTLGIFQLESSGMTALITEIKPQSIDDLAITISLFRPGPLKNRAQFLARRFGKEQFRYWIPAFAPILSATYGIPLYQEQIILLVQAYANFDLATADQLRQIISKKQAQHLPAMETQFFAHANKLGRAKALTQKVWALIAEFIGYGFNRGHAIAYAYIAYWMAYLKTHHSALFYREILNKSIGDKTKTTTVLGELRQSQALKTFCVDINFSQLEYQIDFAQATLYLPFNLINQIGTVYARRIYQERTAQGPFKSLTNFIHRMLKHGLSETLLERLIRANCFANLETINQATLLKNLNTIWVYAEVTNTGKKNQQAVLATLAPTKLPVQRRDPAAEWKNEYESFGFYLTFTHLKAYQKKLKFSAHQVSVLTALTQQITGQPSTKKVWIVVVGKIQAKETQTGKKIAFLTVFDQSGSLEVACFSRVWEAYSKQITPGSLIACRLKRTVLREKITFVCEMIYNIAKSLSND